MGNKARNAGKKQSKTCNKLANSRSVRMNGKGLKIVVCRDTPLGNYIKEERIKEMSKKHHLTHRTDITNYITA